MKKFVVQDLYYESEVSSKLENGLGMEKGVYLLLKDEVHLMFVEVLMPLQ